MFPKYILVLVVLLTVGLFACGDASASSLVGTWRSSNPPMRAHVSHGHIRIVFVDDTGASDLYWKGTFLNRARNGDKFVSIGDTEAMSESFFGSYAKIKRFTYRNGRLSFKLWFFDIVHTVILKQ